MDVTELIKGLEPFDQPIPYSRQVITEGDKSAVMDVLDSPWIAGGGPKTKEFEEGIAEYTGWKHAIATNSCTSGLFAAVSSGVLGSEGKFKIPALTFVSTANVLRSMGYFSNRIQLVDVSPYSLVHHGADIGVSYAGYPVKFSPIADDAHYIFPSSSSEGRGCTVAVMSFHPLKPLTTGEGGMVLTNDDMIAAFVRRFIDLGRTVKKEGANRYQSYGYGHNLRMSDIQAALGVSQLSRAFKMLQKREQLADIYNEVLSTLGDHIVLPATSDEHSWHLYVIRSQSIPRDVLQSCLDELNIKSEVHYPPLYLYNHIRFNPGNHVSLQFPHTENVWKNGLSIPMFSGLAHQDAHTIAEYIRAIIERWLALERRRNDAR